MAPRKQVVPGRGFPVALVFLFLLPVAVAQPRSLRGREKWRQHANGLQSFYIVGGGPFESTYILAARVHDGDVVVRFIRFEPANRDCPGPVTLKAVEARLAGVAISQLTGGVDLCSIKEKDADSAILRAKSKFIFSGDSGASSTGIVARCGDGDKLFRLPDSDVDLKQLKARRPQVAALFDLERRVFDRAFDDKVFFDNIPAGEDWKLRHFAATLVPELSTGLYDLGFADSDARTTCAGKSPCDLGITRSLLKRYPGPDVRIPGPTVTLLEPDPHSFVHYVAPQYPPSAKMLRIEGKVTMELTVDDATGNVIRSHVTSAAPTLAGEAGRAAREWMFQPSGPETARKITAVLEFSLACREVPGK